jgi:hypothetical protein
LGNIKGLKQRGLEKLKCPKEIRLCPEGWVDCSLCRYASLTIGIDPKTGKRKHTCLYAPKYDLDIVVLAAKIAEQVMHTAAVESAEKIKGNLQSEEDFWAWWGRSSPPHFNEKPVLPAGPSEPGGGSKNKAKKSKTGNKVFMDVWSGF